MTAQKIGELVKTHAPKAALEAIKAGSAKLGEAKESFDQALGLSAGEQVIADTIISGIMTEAGAGAIKFTGEVAVSTIEGLKEARAIRGARNAAPPIKASAINKTPVEFTSTTGTKQTYKVFQRTDIDWDMVRTSTKGDKRFVGKTNREAARAGVAPELVDGSSVPLHHVGQNAKGPLVEVSGKIHQQHYRALHNQHGRGMKHPEFPVAHDSKWKSDVREYWKWRIKNE